MDALTLTYAELQEKLEAETETFFLLNLTPELAREIRAANTTNRKIRPANLARIKREIVGGFWNPAKSAPIRFIDKRLADGQHRIWAVDETGIAVTILVATVKDTLGVDEGANRTIADYLVLSRGLDGARAGIAATLVRALCPVDMPGNRELLGFYDDKEAFIRECIDRAEELVADKAAPIPTFFKVGSLALWRARALAEFNEPPAIVDQLLADTVSGGVTAPEGSVRRSCASQFYENIMQPKFRKPPATKDVLRWISNAAQAEAEGRIRNIITSRPRKSRKQQPAAAAVAA